MNKLNERLIELIDEKGVQTRDIAKTLGLSSLSTIYMWKKGERSILVDNAMKLADVFDCSVDYLVGRSDNYKDNVYDKINFDDCPPFSEQLRKVLAEQKVSQNKLIKFTNISAHSLNNWLNDKGKPHIESVIEIADYLDISIDELVGREK